ncbi:MAG TPA: DUF4147 domain-containing protein [Thermomicrobiales bacterium]|nr:DUF4147 domain-containing protein [Thermomicrobiales bacterium]
MIDLRPLSGPVREGYTLVADLFGAAVAAVDPESATAAAIRVDDGALTVGERSVPLEGRVIVVGMGKAAARMAIGAERALAAAHVSGVVVVKDPRDPRVQPERITVLEASHPLPDARSIAAGDRLLAEVTGADSGDVVLALISGGGSALAESLWPPGTLADLRSLTDLMLRAGATINQLNAVRRALSRIKAGGLLAASPVPVVPVILSDVIGNDLGTIASGAAIPGPDRGELRKVARRTIDELGLTADLPPVIAAALHEDAGRDLPAASTEVVPPVFIGDNAAAVQAMIGRVRATGRMVSVPDAWQGRTGEASLLGREFVDACRSAAADIDVVVGGGEATVTVRGDGDGGRNTEFALAAALCLDESRESGWVIASLATDGEDANTGAAGAAVDGRSIERASSAGIDGSGALARNDSLPWCRAAGGLVVPGSTGTNVNDLYIGVRVRSDEATGATEEETR